MSELRSAAEQALKALGVAQDHWNTYHGLRSKTIDAAVEALRVALEQPEPTVKESLMVPQHIAEQLTTTDLAWLETRRLVRVWKELGQMRWMGADEGWDKAIEAVRARLDKECQDVLAWKEKADASGETAKQVLQRMRGLKDD